MSIILLFLIFTNVLMQSNQQEIVQSPSSIATGESLRPPPPPSPKLQLVYQWAEIIPRFPDAPTRTGALASGAYVPGNSIPIDVDVYYPKNRSRGRPSPPRVFVTIPRMNVGRPITLATVVDGRVTIPIGAGLVSGGALGGLRGPQLAPYPNYDWHKDPNDCNGLTSVFRISIDKCDRLWVLDTGRVSTNQLCAPKIISFDLNTDTLLSKHNFPANLYRQLSLFVTPVIDIREDACKNTFIYIADVTGFGIIVYDQSRDLSWRIENKLFYPFPSYGTHRIAGQQFDLMDGILSMALSPWQPGRFPRDRTLYFHALSSVTENKVQTSIIRNSSIFLISTRSATSNFEVFPQTRSTQSAPSAIDKDGVMYFGLNEQLAIGCWNTAKPYGAENVIAAVTDPRTLQFASGVKIVTNAEGVEELWILTSSFQRYMTRTLSNNTINFRVLVGDPKALVKGTLCEPASSSISPPVKIQEGFRNNVLDTLEPVIGFSEEYY